MNEFQVNKKLPNKKLMLVYNTFQNEEQSFDLKDVVPNWQITTDRQYLHQADIVTFYLPDLLHYMEDDLYKTEEQIWVGWFLKSEKSQQPWINNSEIMDIFDLLEDYSMKEIINGYYLVQMCRKINDSHLYKYSTKNTICLYTLNFPYGVGEQFIETEIKYLSKSFERIIIIPLQRIGIKRHIPENAEVKKPNFGYYTKSKGFQDIGKWFFYCFNDIIKSKNKKEMTLLLFKTSFMADILYNFLEKNKITNVIHYTYWFDYHATLLSILKSKNKIDNFMSRAHGFDLYDERRKERYIPFRKLQLQYVSNLYLISKNGLNYITEKYPQYHLKYKLSYLGTNNFSSTKGKQTPEYLFVSCSRIIDIKQVDKIVESLALIKNIPIKWVHFGDGPLFEKIEKLAIKLIPDNINVLFYGHVDNKVIYNFYQTEMVDCFINLSSTEGLPVSIMEAISFGIPVIAANVGGNCEIVTNEVGILLKTNFEIEDVKNAILEVLTTKSRNSFFRNGVYRFWRENFDADKNYPVFIDDILYNLNPLKK